MTAPFIINGSIKSWPSSALTPEILSGLLSKESIEFRIGRKEINKLQYETECSYIKATLSEFVTWSSTAQGSKAALPKDSPFNNYSFSENWCYADYKYMKDLFINQEKVLKAVDWSTLGLPDRDGKESTFWLGSSGAYTVCHYDTYGWNLVAQLYGRKKWVLFPPEQSELLYPTRIPYEESSVFSQVHIANPDIEQYPKFKKTTPYVVTLEPGQVLYVPRHWWHYVECLETAISVNTWVEMEEDSSTRLKEAVTRNIVCAVMQDLSADWSNPTEEEQSMEENISILQNTLRAATAPPNVSNNEVKNHLNRFLTHVKQFKLPIHHCQKYTFADYIKQFSKHEKRHLSLRDDEVGTRPSGKKLKTDNILENTEVDCVRKVNNTESGTKTGTETPISNHPILPQGSMGNELESNVNNLIRSGVYHKSDALPVEDIANCFVDDQVVHLICQKLKEKYKEKNVIK